MGVMARELTKAQLIERSVYKKYRKEIWANFLTAINRYDLIEAGDHIAVCISGGKDSMLLGKLMQMLQKQSEIPFELTYLVMDPGYKPEIRAEIEANAELLQLPLTIFETNIFAVTDVINHRSPCYLCAKMRRGALYSKARELGCNKIALGHHLNDVIETTVMAMFYSSKLETIIPKSHSENYEDMELIRPLYMVKEHDILRWVNYNDLSFIQCACKFTERLAENDEEVSSKRREVKALIQQLKRENPNIEDNIFRSLHAVQIETFPGYKKDGVLHDFREIYPKK